MTKGESAFCTVAGTALAWIVLALVSFVLVGCPKYGVYMKSMNGKAELAEAESNRKIKTLEAEAAQESAKYLANAEVIRAEGVAKSNKIIGDSLQGNESYLHYLWIQGLQHDGATTVYVPTEANLPILEAGKRP